MTSMNAFHHWARAAFLVVLAHLALATALFAWPLLQPPASLERDAIPIELTILTVATPPIPDVPEPPNIVEPEPQQLPQLQPEPQTPPPVPDISEPQNVVEPEPQQLTPLQPEPQTPASVKTRDPASLPKPPRKPTAEQKPKPLPPREVRVTNSDRETATRLAAERQRVAQQEAQAAGAAWKGLVAAHINRTKRYPAGASGSGTVSVSFTISRNGQVLSARLSGSSGTSAFDLEALALLRRANPIPAPPSGFGGETISLSIPIRFKN